VARRQNNVGVSITGGLGNQLFQVAAALSISGGEQITIISSYGKPRLSKKNEAEIYSLTDKEEWFERDDANRSWLVAKCVGYVLRMGVQPKTWEKGLFALFITKIANLIVSVSRRKRIWLLAGEGVGYFKLPEKKSGTLLSGYFQTYNWASNEDVYKKLFKLHPKQTGPELEYFETLSANRKPLVIHIRLGDYLSEDNFGIPTIEYYKSAISKITEVIEIDEIWVFSDSLTKASEILSLDASIKVRWVGELDDSTSSTFQAMRLGAAYIIGNSTFSWWAAFLRLDDKAPVIAPTPWFRGMDEPLELIPGNWTRIDAGY
jgi:hypothetical protein